MNQISMYIDQGIVISGAVYISLCVIVTLGLCLLCVRKLFFSPPNHLVVLLFVVRRRASSSSL